MTRREQIIELLKKEERTVKSLANIFATTPAEILEDLKHIEISIKPLKLKYQPAFCKKCGFVFKERDKIKKPSKCPRCRAEWIKAQVFRIE